MSIQKNKPEQIVTVLRQIEVETANGKTTLQACQDAQITVQTYSRISFLKTQRQPSANLQRQY